MTTLGDVVVDAQPGFACGQDDPDGIFQIRMHNISGRCDLVLDRKRRVPRRAHRAIDSFAVRAGDVLFNATNSPDTVGKSVLAADFGEPVVFSNHFLRLRTDPDRLIPAYLWRWLQVQFQLGVFQGMCRQWVNQATVSRDGLLALPIALPQLSEQRRIVRILDRVDAVRSGRRTVIDRLGELESSVFVEAFGGDTPRRSLRSIGVDFVSGKNVVAGDGDADPIRRIIKVSAISSGRFRPLESKPMPAGYLPPPAHLLKTGDVLFGRASGSLDLVGALAVVDLPVENLYLPDKVWRLVVRPDAPVSERFVLGVLRSGPARAYIRHNASGAAGVRNIGKSKLLDFAAPVPSSDEQRRYCQRAETVDAQLHRQFDAAAKDDELFAAVQARAFRGEL